VFPINGGQGKLHQDFLLHCVMRKNYWANNVHSAARYSARLKKTCPFCYVDTKDWKEVGPKGKVITYTVVYRQQAALKKNVPVAFGLIQLEGSANAMLHYIEGIEPEKIAIGMEVEAVFADDKSASIQAISHFRPVQ